MAEAKKNATAATVPAPVTTSKSTGPSVDFDSLQHVTAAAIAGTVQRGGNGALSVNIVCSQANGKRVKLSKALFDALGSPEQVQVAQNGNHLIIGETLPKATETFPFSKGSGFNILYRPALVHWLIDTFNLDYSDCVSKSFGKIKLGSKDFNGSTITYAVVDMTA